MMTRDKEHKLAKDAAITIVSTRLNKTEQEVENLLGVLLDSINDEEISAIIKELKTVATVENCIEILSK